MAVDLFTLPHKALRHALATAGTALAADQPEAVALATAALDALADHGHHEDLLILPLLREHLPALAAEQDAQHAALTARVDAVRRLLDGLDDDPATRLAAYRAVQRLGAVNLVHLDHEETVVQPALVAAAPAGATEEVMARFRASHPDPSALFRRWPEALTPAERALVLA